MSLHACIASGRQTLVDAGFRPDDAAIDADVLARHVLGWDLARLLAHNREPASADFIERFEKAIGRRARREPVALITGHREFWGLDFIVTPDTLVPRPETEFIVEEALRQIPLEASTTVLDIGTGTGCLAVAIASERPRCRIVATDISQGALMVARQNARTHGVGDRIHFVRTDLSSGVLARADVIVSNPPYVPDYLTATLPPDVVRYEPDMALFGGGDGLAIIRRLFSDVDRNLTTGGCVVMEFGFGQEEAVRSTAAAQGWHAETLIHDLQGIPRTIVLRRQP
jgi:release factor glutamine methyltransferase